MIKYLFVILFFICTTTYGQNYKWLSGGGSDDPLIGLRNYVSVVKMVPDQNGNLYFNAIVGESLITVDTFFLNHTYNSGSGDQQVFIGSYNCSGKLKWGKVIEASNQTTCSGLVYDNNGGIYMSVWFSGSNKHIGNDTIISTRNLFCSLIKLDTSGHFKWVRFIGVDRLYPILNMWPEALAIDGEGYIHAYDRLDSGTQITSTIFANDTGIYDIKYDPSGNIASVIKLPIDYNMYLESVTINQTNGDVYTVMYDVNASAPNCIGAYSNTGIQKWVDTVHSYPYEIKKVKFDNNNGLYCIGYGPNVILGKDTIDNNAISTIVKLDTNGRVTWTYGIHGCCSHGFDNGYLRDITLLDNGNIAGTGIINAKLWFGNDTLIETTGELDNPFVFMIDTLSRVVLLDQQHGDAIYDWGSVIIHDNLNNLYVGGQEGDTFSVGSLPYYLKNGGEYNFYIAKYGYNCNCTIATEPTPNFLASGTGTVSFSYTGSVMPDSVKWDFGDGQTSIVLNPIHNFYDTGVHHVCLTVYACDSGTYCGYIHTTVWVPHTATMSTINVYPNPTSEQFIIDGAEIGMAARLYNSIGQIVFDGIIMNKKEAIDTRNLYSGTYILQLMNKEGNMENIIVVKQ